ncbi:MAG: HEPN domain-containing protein [Parcubacteria group bacterium Gr01-1014_66]|nr:MAG: HEPN domain-containing protein [Parcubacteria group bacterium Gr01-1014_66]
MTPKYTADWFARGDDDLKTIEILLAREGIPAVICFHAQQTGEKYLKGFLAFHEKHVRKIHDLAVLLDACRVVDPTFEALREDARFLIQMTTLSFNARMRRKHQTPLSR